MSRAQTLSALGEREETPKVCSADGYVKITAKLTNGEMAVRKINEGRQKSFDLYKFLLNFNQRLVTKVLIIAELKCFL